MRNMKKLTMLAILLTITLMCSACGGKDDISGQISELEDQEVSENVQSEINEAGDESDAAEEEEANTPLSLGRIQGGVYTNEYVGMACELDSSWEFYAAEELQDMSYIKEAIEGSLVGEMTKDWDQFIDMQAENEEELTSINVLYQKMTAQQRLASMNINENKIVEDTVAQKDLLVESYAQAGVMVEEMAKKTVTFMGKERVALWTKATVEEIDYYTLQIFDTKAGEYIVTTTFASFIEDKTEDMLQLFYAL